MRRVACEQHAAVAEAVHAQAGEGVDAGPLQLELGVRAQQRLHARDDVLELFLFFGVGVPTELEVDAPHVVGLAVQQHALVGVERRVEPEPAFGREVGLHDHVGDQEAVLEHMAFDVQTELAPHIAARPIGDDQPVGVDLEVAVGRFEAHAGAAVAVISQRLNAHHLVFPAQVHTERFGAPHQRFFQVVLLQVDHAGALVAGVGHEVEAVDLFFAQEGAAHVPAHALVDDGVADAEAVEDFERALGVADGARAEGDAVFFVEQQHVQPLQAGVDGGGETDRAGPDDDQRFALRCALHEVGRAGVREGGVGVGGHPSSAPSLSPRVRNGGGVVRVGL